MKGSWRDLGKGQMGDRDKKKVGKHEKTRVFFTRE